MGRGMKPISITIHGKRWRYTRPRRIVHKGDECDGLCNFNKRTISVRSQLEGTYELEVTLHEVRHSLSDFLDEEFVDKDSAQLADILTKLGYRKLTKYQRDLLGID